jgi:hypothetical protein
MMKLLNNNGFPRFCLWNEYLLLAYNPSQERKKKTSKVQKRNGPFMLWYLLLPWRFGRWTDELDRKRTKSTWALVLPISFFSFSYWSHWNSQHLQPTHHQSVINKTKQQLGKHEKRMMLSSQCDTYFPKWRRVWTEKPQMLQSCQHGHYYH